MLMERKQDSGYLDRARITALSPPNSLPLVRLKVTTEMRIALMPEELVYS